MIDWDKPLVTRDGRKATVISMTRKTPDNQYPIVALVERDEHIDDVFSFTAEGRYVSSGCHDLDLVNVPTERTVLWINLYLAQGCAAGYRSGGSCYKTEAEARNAAGGSGHFGTFPITFKE
jgi:hypothetical protein